VVCCGGWWWVGMNIIREYNSFWGGGFVFMLVRSFQFLKESMFLVVCLGAYFG